MIRSAVISDDNRYRYLLERRWGGGNPLCFIMLNPSTADDRADDPTIRRCIGLATGLGYGAIVVANLFAFRTTYPKELRLLSRSQAVGPDNGAYLESAIAEAGGVVAAWGWQGGAVADWVRSGETVVRSLCATHGRKLYQFATCKDGSPRHPLYLKSNLPLQERL